MRPFTAVNPGRGPTLNLSLVFGPKFAEILSKATRVMI